MVISISLKVYIYLIQQTEVHNFTDGFPFFYFIQQLIRIFSTKRNKKKKG